LAQAIGMVLLEEQPVDKRGNPKAATFKDYLLPSISDVPEFEFVHANTPSKSIGGMRGVGEGGAIIGPPTLVNAIADALSPFGEIDVLELPLTPAKVLDVIEQRDVSGAAARRAAETGAPEEVTETPVASAATEVEPATAPGAPVDGDWDVTMKPPMGPEQQMVAHFETDGDALTGYLDAPEGKQEFTGTAEAGRLKWQMKVEKPLKITLKYDLAVEGDTLSGKCKLGLMGSAQVTGTRRAG
jgi:carbon-monoxide dehydrogenase large subunit